MVRFIHTADWQLGMTRHFLSDEAQARYSEARLEAIISIAGLARSEGCSFVVVGGDVFESNLLDRQVVVRSLDAMRSFDVPVYLLPGNHDPSGAGSVYRSKTFLEHRPDHVVVLEPSRRERVPGTDVEVIGAPWDSKRPLEDLVTRACRDLDVEDEVLRVLVGHGAVDEGSPNPTNPALIGVAALEARIDEGAVHYVALGDRHSVTEVGRTGRVWYSGTPLVTDYDEIEPNHVLLVELDAGSVHVERRLVGTWRFLRSAHEVNNLEEVALVEQWLDEVPAKRSTVVKLSFVGTLSLSAMARLDAVLDHHRDLFAALETWERHTDLHVLPDDDDLSDLALAGFAADAVEELRALATSNTPRAVVAQDALGLLYRLAGRSS